MKVNAVITMVLFLIVLMVSCMSKGGNPCIDDTECPEGQYCNMDSPVFDETDQEWKGECEIKVSDDKDDEYVEDDENTDNNEF